MLSIINNLTLITVTSMEALEKHQENERRQQFELSDNYISKEGSEVLSMSLLSPFDRAIETYQSCGKYFQELINIDKNKSVASLTDSGMINLRLFTYLMTPVDSNAYMTSLELTGVPDPVLKVFSECLSSDKITRYQLLSIMGFLSGMMDIPVDKILITTKNKQKSTEHNVCMQTTTKELKKFKSFPCTKNPDGTITINDASVNLYSGYISTIYKGRRYIQFTDMSKITEEEIARITLEKFEDFKDCTKRKNTDILNYITMNSTEAPKENINHRIASKNNITIVMKAPEFGQEKQLFTTSVFKIKQGITSMIKKCSTSGIDMSSYDNKVASASTIVELVYIVADISCYMNMIDMPNNELTDDFNKITRDLCNILNTQANPHQLQHPSRADPAEQNVIIHRTETPAKKNLSSAFKNFLSIMSQMSQEFSGIKTLHQDIKKKQHNSKFIMDAASFILLHTLDAGKGHIIGSAFKKEKKVKSEAATSVIDEMVDMAKKNNINIDKSMIHNLYFFEYLITKLTLVLCNSEVTDKNREDIDRVKNLSKNVIGAFPIMCMVMSMKKYNKLIPSLLAWFDMPIGDHVEYTCYVQSGSKTYKVLRKKPESDSIPTTTTIQVLGTDIKKSQYKVLPSFIVGLTTNTGCSDKEVYDGVAKDVKSSFAIIKDNNSRGEMAVSYSGKTIVLKKNDTSTSSVKSLSEAQVLADSENSMAETATSVPYLSALNGAKLLSNLEIWMIMMSMQNQLEKIEK